MKALGVLPARYGASRFPGKALARVGGMAVLEHAWRRLSAAPGIGRVVIATDEPAVAEAARAFGAQCLVSGAPHATGTDRSAEAARGGDEAIVVNLQLDQPFLSPRAIGEAVAQLARRPEFEMSTLVRRVSLSRVAEDPDGATVAVGADGRCLYFSRAALPPRGLAAPGEAEEPWVWRHIGLYCYRREALHALSASPRTPLESSEGLEQLRALELGMGILAVPTAEPSFNFHRPEEIPAAEAFLEGPGRLTGAHA